MKAEIFSFVHFGDESAPQARGPWWARVGRIFFAARLNASSHVASRNALYHPAGVATRSRTSSSPNWGTPVSGGLPICLVGGRGFLRSPISSIVSQGPSRRRGHSPVHTHCPSWHIH